MKFISTCCLAALSFIVSATAQTLPNSNPTAPVAATANTASPAAIHIPAGTIVHVALVDTLSSRTNHIGDTFALRLVDPIVVDGREVVAAGAVGGGEVIDAAASGLGGRQGKLIISARFLEINGQHVRIHGMQLTAAGTPRDNEAMAVSMIPYAGVIGIFVHGGEIDIPAGANGPARIANDVDFTPPSVPPPVSTEAAPQATPTATSP
ncbi:MAG: hypothetical protein HY054_09895 [Proteobacteria bacterium]|nr:hypothetical protein [Pseudomonadota bacterium]